MDVRAIADDALAEATGRAHRKDEVLAGTGGPAGNARLTAWTGLVLLVLFAAELVTLLDVRGLVSWHVAIGVLLIPPALVKTGSTGWRIVRYYAGNRPYRTAGPPPLLMRLLGPLVVVFTLAVLGTGVALILAGRGSLFTVAGRPVDVLFLHKAAFVVWAVVTGLHTLGRLIPALQLTVLKAREPRRVPGPYQRATVLGLTLLVAGAATALTLALVDLTPWHTPEHRPGDFRLR